MSVSRFFRQPPVLACFALILAGGLWLFLRDGEPVAPDATADPAPPGKTAAAEAQPAAATKLPAPQEEQRPGADETTVEEANREEEPLPTDAISGERTFAFKSPGALAAAEAELRASGYDILGRLRSLNALRVATPGDRARRAEQIVGDFGGEPQFSIRLNTPTQIPEGLLAEAGVQPTGPPSAALGANPSVVRRFGEGTRVAVLDSGLNGSIRLASPDVSVNLQLDDIGSPNDHGSLVAAIIAGREGTAPRAAIDSFQVTDAEGVANSFDIAEAIVQATDKDADVINLSLGSYGDSPLMRDAIAYASRKGAVVVAAAGNDAAGQVTFPASVPEVVAVGAVDGSSTYAPFSNQGAELDLVAPGVLLTLSDGKSNNPFASAPTKEESFHFSGTSAAAPVVSGAIAALMSENEGMSSRQAADLLIANANDSGPGGEDVFYGAGSLNFPRALSSGNPGLVDTGISRPFADYAEASGANVPVVVNAQNRGTETLNSADVDITMRYLSPDLQGELESNPENAGNRLRQVPPITTTAATGILAPGESQSFSVNVNLRNLADGSAVLITTTVQSDGDQIAENNESVSLIRAPAQ